MKKLIAANWKMFKNPTQIREFFHTWKAKSKDPAHQIKNDLIFFPPALGLEATSQALQDTPILWGSQNAYFQGQGAFTGETSAQVVKEMGGQFVLLGHSERRQHFFETDELLAKKFQYVQSLSLTPMLCIGETLEQREKGLTNQVLSVQLEKALISRDESQNLVIAYEPVWAIGTGKVALPQQVADTHAHVKTVLKDFGLEDVEVLYGGSVKADNCKELAALPGVDGFLVGGASLEVDTFLPIARC